MRALRRIHTHVNYMITFGRTLPKLVAQSICTYMMYMAYVTLFGLNIHGTSLIF